MNKVVNVLDEKHNKVAEIVKRKVESFVDDEDLKIRVELQFWSTIDLNLRWFARSIHKVCSLN